MFTGIVETTAIVQQVIESGTNRSFWLSASLVNELKIDQSVCHDGVCLTVEEINNSAYKVTAIAETLTKSNLALRRQNDEINIERCLQMNGRIDGHIVQGHVDATAVCIYKKDNNGSWLYTFSFEKQFAPLLIEKGSVCLNGISLTAFDVTDEIFSVAVIPYTYHHTNIHSVTEDSVVNIEFDMIGKYLNRYFKLSSLV